MRRVEIDRGLARIGLGLARGGRPGAQNIFEIEAKELAIGDVDVGMARKTVHQRAEIGRRCRRA